MGLKELNLSQRLKETKVFTMHTTFMATWVQATLLYKLTPGSGFPT